MKALQQFAFDYCAYDPDTQAFLHERANRIHKLARVTAEGIVLIGEYLTEVKQRLQHGEFLAWIKHHFAWSEWTARNFMNVHERFKTRNFHDLTIDASALYLIAAPKTPEPVRTEVLRRAEAGESVPHQAAQAIVQHYAEHGTVPPDTVSTQGLAAMQAESNRLRQEARQLFPSPAKAREQAIETGMHTLDWNGTYQIPLTKDQEAEYRAERARIEPIEDFLTWFATDAAPSPTSVLPLLRKQHWLKLYLTDRAAIQRAAKWWTELAKELYL